jgi:hypothetical protein
MYETRLTASNQPLGNAPSSTLQVESILNPVRGIRDAQIRAGITPTNHARNNVLAVKEQSRLNALSKLQEQDVAAEQQQQRQYRRSSSSNGGVSGGLSRAASSAGARLSGGPNKVVLQGSDASRGVELREVGGAALFF